MRNTENILGNKKVIRGWILYDWANSVYQLTIASTIFPIYYNTITRTGTDETVLFFGSRVTNTVLYALAISVAYLFVALTSPLFSSLADFTGRRRAFMKVFTWIGSLSCGMLFFFDRTTVELGIIAFSLGTLGYAGSIVFYNSFLPVIAAPEDQDRISAKGYSMGYLGGVVLLLFNLLMIKKPDWFGIPDGSTLAARLSFLTVCLWWIGFAQITFRRLPKYTFRKRTGEKEILSNGYRELTLVFRQVRRSFRLSGFLAGYFFMMMGVLTIMMMATSYGEKQLRMPEEVLIPTVLVIQLVGMGGAWFFARLSGKIGNFRALIACIAAWILISIGAYFITDVAGFVTAAFFIGIVMGGSQSLARSTYSKMIPATTTDHTSFFSFYDVLEKLSMVGGTAIFALVEHMSGSMRISVLAMAGFFVLSLVFLVMVAVRKDVGRGT